MLMIYSTKWQVSSRFLWNKTLSGSEMSDVSQNLTEWMYSMEMRGKTEIQCKPVRPILCSGWEAFLGYYTALSWRGCMVHEGRCCETEL